MLEGVPVLLKILQLATVLTESNFLYVYLNHQKRHTLQLAKMLTMTISYRPP